MARGAMTDQHLFGYRRNFAYPTKGKDVEETDDYTLVWNGHGFNEPVERRLASLGSMQRSIFDYVEQNPRCTQAAIVEHLGRTKQQINEAVGRMLELGLLKNASDGRLFVNNTA